MSLRCPFAIIGAFAFLLAPAFAQQQSAPPVPSAKQVAPPQSTTASIPAYPDSPKGLEKLMKEMLKLEKSGDLQALGPYVQSLVLPDADNWFRTEFGDQIGETLANLYQREAMEMSLSFPDLLASLVKQKVGNPEGIEFTDSCNPSATPHEYPILVLRRNSNPLYDVRFTKGMSLLVLSYFAYEGGAFRYLGNFEVSQSWPIGKTTSQSRPVRTPPDRVRLTGNVVAARIIYQPKPEYPVEARLAGIQGTVLFHAIIAKDGTLRELQLVQGQCWLAEAAIKAVRQWRYTPYLFNGKPVEVDTTIQAIFNIR